MNPLESRHLTQDTLVGILYGLEPASPHLKTCSECQSRFTAMQSAREATSRFVVSSDKLREQRTKVLERSSRSMWQPRAVWVPVALAAMAAVTIVITQQPRPERAPEAMPNITAEVLEANWFEETYSAQASEPRAISPLRHLFVTEAAAE